ncbi:hypothetical protein [uncultured Nocardioides sp.]|uniref:hypothetical protein n=1 Tax=uncultured Nocardioides sp. TaxID=198441 RepID=UPI00261E9335|nr:hypothetical protein [uncultured Nocardioides sp.]
MNIVTRAAALVGTTAAIALPVTLLNAPAANADVDRQGSCGGAQFDFSVDRDDDRRNSYEISFDLDRAADVKYRVVLKQNGNTYYNAARTPDREGDIEVERNRANTSGADTFLFKYRNTVTDKVCSRTITVR